jgi:hypothetical protein
MATYLTLLDLIIPIRERQYCDVHAVGQQSTVRRLFTAVAMQRNNGSDQRFLCGPFTGYIVQS